MNEVYILRLLSIALLSATLLNLYSCRNDDNPIPLECVIGGVNDNMPFQDDDYVKSFSVYPRRIHLFCSIKNTSDRYISLPFESSLDTISSSKFKVIVNHSDEIPIMVNCLSQYDKLNIKPNEIITFEICVFILRYKKGKLATMPLMDLLRLLEFEYQKSIEDKSLSENRMANIHFLWNKNLRIIREEKRSRTIRCGL